MNHAGRYELLDWLMMRVGAAGRGWGFSFATYDEERLLLGRSFMG